MFSLSVSFQYSSILLLCNSTSQPQFKAKFGSILAYKIYMVLLENLPEYLVSLSWYFGSIDSFFVFLLSELISNYQHYLHWNLRRKEKAVKEKANNKEKIKWKFNPKIPIKALSSLFERNVNRRSCFSAKYWNTWRRWTRVLVQGDSLG